jgi:hypothetical protein
MEHDMEVSMDSDMDERKTTQQCIGLRSDSTRCTTQTKTCFCKHHEWQFNKLTDNYKDYLNKASSMRPFDEDFWDDEHDKMTEIFKLWKSIKNAELAKIGDRVYKEIIDQLKSV